MADSAALATNKKLELMKGDHLDAANLLLVGTAALKNRVGLRVSYGGLFAQPSCAVACYLLIRLHIRLVPNDYRCDVWATV
jgi:hypothetical protein